MFWRYYIINFFNIFQHPPSIREILRPLTSFILYGVVTGNLDLHTSRVKCDCLPYFYVDHAEFEPAAFDSALGFAFIMECGSFFIMRKFTKKLSDTSLQ